ncbi:MAG: cation-translocating P-type ATPase [Deltaproteobacteria bacterium]|jgi:heavy metal translocating P-type ATPase|nr:cation-translocating P-type ATPase [Deltaproteobacteria bacterium]
MINLNSFLANDSQRTWLFVIVSLMALVVDFFNLFPKLPFSASWAAVLLCGIPILKGAAIGLLTHFDVKADVLVAMALIAAVYIGEIFAAGEVAFIMTLGSMLEERTVRKAREGLEKLVSLTPVSARVINSDSETIVEAGQVKSDDIVRVLAGEIIPVDGEIVFGRTAVDQSLLTGESIPADKDIGDEVFSGTVNQLGTFDFKATKVGEDSSIIRMIRLVESAEASKTPIVRIMDRWASYIVGMALATALITFGVTGESIRAVTILVVFCPCALVLSTPTAIMAGIGNASHMGIIISSGEALERLAKVKVAAFDKTGTLTHGRPEVTAAVTAKEVKTQDLWVLAATAEERSEHPLGRAVRRQAEKNQVKTLEISEFQLVPSRGVRVVASGRHILAGNADFLTEEGLTIEPQLAKEAESCRKLGQAVVFVGSENKTSGFIALADTIRDEARQTITSIESEGVKTILLTGDHAEAAAFIAERAGIKEVRSELRPEDKVRIIAEEFENKGCGPTLMVGDGLNDAPALKSAYVSLAMGGAGSGLAVEAADGVLVRDDLNRIPHLLRLARKTAVTIKFNITLSMLLNLVAVYLAASGLMGPVTGALFHNLGAFLIVFNSARLYSFKTDGGDFQKTERLSSSIGSSTA